MEDSALNLVAAGQIGLRQLNGYTDRGAVLRQ